jgi:L-ascorbate metabolism protein UlaG (beta-lactamase superfamily)
MKRLLLVLPILLVAGSLSEFAIDILGRAPDQNSGTVENTPLQQQGSVDITYIANEGLLISSGDKQVLIDGLHRKSGSLSRYAFLQPPKQEEIETAKRPFDTIDLVLVSHMHYDHFHAESVGLHLKNNSGATLVSSQQVADEVENRFKDYQAIKARVIGATPPWKGRIALKVAGIDFEILGIKHGGEQFSSIQNLGHIIKLGGKKLLHVGDADTTIENFDELNLDEEGIDIAFIPFWFLIDKAGQSIVKEQIKPRHIIAVHMDAFGIDKTTRRIKEVFPDAIVFTTIFEKRQY